VQDTPHMHETFRPMTQCLGKLGCNYTQHMQGSTPPEHGLERGSHRGAKGKRELEGVACVVPPA
jgi:hypothetical protein